MARWSRRSALVGLGAAGPAVLGCRGKSTDPAPRGAEPDSVARVARTIEAVQAMDGDGATVFRVFPTAALRNLDPFVLLDDFRVSAPAGFPDHPHRGFEAFTYMIDGAFHHRDNLGNDSRIQSGGTQRFNSGRGARHSEMPGSDGVNRGLQLWVNLPRRLKTMQPEYEGLHADRLPWLEQADRTIRTIVGEGSPVGLHTAVDYLDISLTADATFSRTIPLGNNTLVYVIDGGIELDGHRLRRGQGALVDPGVVRITGTAGGRFAYLSGRPHHEPIIHRGPFVD